MELKDKKILITGITGFVGSHLAEYCLKKPKVKVYGTILSHHLGDELKRIEHIKDKIELLECDLTNGIAVERVLRKVKPEKIFHLAAQSFVPTSWKSPEDTLFNNIFSELNIFEVVREMEINPVIVIACCYSADTRALTRDGFKYFNELKEGNRVLSINPRNENIEYKRVKKVIIQKYKGKMVYFKSRSCDLLVTPNHKMLIKKNKKAKLKFVEADEIKGANYLPLGKVQNSKKINHPLELFYLIGNFIGDGYIVKGEKECLTSGLSKKQYMKLRDKHGRFIFSGRKVHTKIYPFYRGFLAIPRNDKARKKIENILKKLNIKYHAYNREIYFNPPDKLLKIFKACGYGAENKKIPQWILSMPRDCLQELFNGLTDSDGYRRRGRESFTTTSPLLASKFIELCRKIGRWVTLNELPPRKIKFPREKREILSKRAFSFSITDGEKYLLAAKNKKEKFYDGIVWCVEIEDNHNLLVERNGKISFCGNSSEEYGLVLENELPIKETNPLRPLSPYAVSKVTQEKLGFQYYQSYGLKTVLTRFFNTEGPGRGQDFVTSNFAKQIAEIEKGERKPVIYVGNLEAKRDFTDVRDMIRAYWLASEKCKFGEPYNVCSEKARTIKSVLDILLGFSKVKNIKVKQDPKKMRPSDVPLLLGDCSKFRKVTGWKPKIPFEKTMLDLLNYWRENV